MIRMRAEFECDYCGRTVQVLAPAGDPVAEAPGDWMQIPAWEVAGTSQFGYRADRPMHYCSLPCAWWAIRRAQPRTVSVTVLGREGPYGPTVEGWEQPADPRGGR